MNAWGVIGHDWAVEHLRKSMDYRRVRHAYLILGAESVGKETLARAFAMALNCAHPDATAHPCGACSACQRIARGAHPDIVYAQHDATTGALRIEEIRAVAGKLALKPFEARYRIAIFRDFDLARPQAQDALLKTLEEPSPAALLFLLAKSTDANLPSTSSGITQIPEAILPTITSRSQIIRLRPVPAAVIEAALIAQFGAQAEQAALIAHVAGGRVGWAIRALQDPDLLAQRNAALDLLEHLVAQPLVGRFRESDGLGKDRLALYPLLALWQTWWRDLLLLTEGLDGPLTNLDRAETLRVLAQHVSAGEVFAALDATRTALHTLMTTNAQARLTLDVMLMRYPRPHLAHA
jgi:DNA polymerase-3 subunit delta'